MVNKCNIVIWSDPHGAEYQVEVESNGRPMRVYRYRSACGVLEHKVRSLLSSHKTFKAWEALRLSKTGVGRHVLPAVEKCEQRDDKVVPDYGDDKNVQLKFDL